MARICKLILAFMLLFLSGTAQEGFSYRLHLNSFTVPGLPGLHSYAFAQHGNDWLIIGGRLDGLHARQPFNAFPAAFNNTSIYVVNTANWQVFSAPLHSLSVPLQEQLQSTNMNFFQDADTLIITGGYAFSATKGSHITFPYLTSMQVSVLITAIKNGNPISPHIKQVYNEKFAVTGGQLGKIRERYLLVGGHRFDGAYNAQNNPTFVQTYTNEIRWFRLNNTGTAPVVSDYNAVSDPVHLHRRDYNLVLQVFPDGSLGYTISSGVFQTHADLPFLYPVDIKENGYTPIPGFNQYLSNYHSPKAGLYDAAGNTMFSLFFGGISQYYYKNGTLIQDNLVPFVKTISMVLRKANGQLEEYKMPLEFTQLAGASAELLLAPSVPKYSNGVVKLNELSGDSIVLGFVFGGIASTALNPFSNNQTGTTAAAATIYTVSLISNTPTSLSQLPGYHSFDVQVFPNPSHGQSQVRYTLQQADRLQYYVTDILGRTLLSGVWNHNSPGTFTSSLQFDGALRGQLLTLTVIHKGKFTAVKKIMVL